MFLFPITFAIARTGPAVARHYANGVPTRWLGFPCWIILDEYNRVELEKAFDFESTIPLGSFSPAFLKTIALTVTQAAASRKLTAVVRP
jgi:hypothetical protein